MTQQIARKIWISVAAIVLGATALACISLVLGYWQTAAEASVIHRTLEAADAARSIEVASVAAELREYRAVEGERAKAAAERDERIDTSLTQIGEALGAIDKRQRAMRSALDRMGARLQEE